MVTLWLLALNRDDLKMELLSTQRKEPVSLFGKKIHKRKLMYFLKFCGRIFRTHSIPQGVVCVYGVIIYPNVR